jgi:hypothetical protein
MPGVQLVRSFFGLLELYPKVLHKKSELEMGITISDKRLVLMHITNKRGMI